MSLQHLPTIATAEELIERALKRSSKIEQKIRNVDIRARVTATRKVQALTDNLTQPLKKYVKAFPSFNNIHPFDCAIIDLTVGVDELRHSLGGIDWAADKVIEIGGDFSSKLNTARKSDLALGMMKKAYGRMTSVIRRVASNLDFLIKARTVFRKLPAVDVEDPIAVFAGAPNVGKSSIIRAISTGRPEIRAYPFTTKAVSLGHIELKYGNKMQVMDTPGLLDRPDSERNDIEKQGIAALEHLSPTIVFLTDCSGTCGYPMKMQMTLRDELRGRYPEYPWIDMQSKSDLKIVEESKIDKIIPISIEDKDSLEEFRRLLIASL